MTCARSFGGMFRPLLSIALAAGTLAPALAQIKLPAPSPRQDVKQRFATSFIELAYSRPALRGRPVFGPGSELAPLDSMWRTGANSATTVRFGAPVSVGGLPVDSGRYALFTIPGLKQWTVILNKGADAWGDYSYDKKNDVARVQVPVEKVTESMERFTMQFVDITPSTCNLELAWSTTRIRVPIKADLTDLRKRIDVALAADTAKPYEEAAHYFDEVEPDPKRALENVVPALEVHPDHFWLWHLKARSLEQLGRKDEAVAAAKTCIEEAAKEKDAAYQRTCQALIDRVKKP